MEEHICTIIGQRLLSSGGGYGSMKYTISNSNKEQLRDLIMPYVKMSDMEKLRVYYSILAVLDKGKKPDA